MSTALQHISVCICTYKRPALLKRLLVALDSQDTDGLFTYSVVVVDNDRASSAEPVVQEFSAASSIAVAYHVEPRQNISLARNRAIASAGGDFIAFIDDDEFPIQNWLLILYRTCTERGVDGVLGPVKPHFDEQPPAWVVQGGFYDRPSYPTGLVIDWRKGRTGNVLLRKHLFEGDATPFRPEFLTGEDQDFFGRMIEKGHIFIWCDEALAYETVPPVRWKRTFMLRRALLSGANDLEHRTFGARQIFKSLLAIPAYAVALPFFFLAGQGPFMSLLVKLFDHAGRILALVGIRPVREHYVTE